MKSSNLKAMLITAFCFVVALCSEIICMDNASDIQEITSYKSQNNHSENYLDILKPEIDNRLCDVILPLNQDENENPSTSWASYLISPVKATLQMASEFISLAHNNPNKAVLVGLVLTYQIAAVTADCWCDCVAFANGKTGGNDWYKPNTNDCREYCLRWCIW